LVSWVVPALADRDLFFQDSHVLSGPTQSQESCQKRALGEMRAKTFRFRIDVSEKSEVKRLTAHHELFGM
jgi:hypothetical protein